AAYWRHGLFYRAAILVERIPDIRTLAQCLDETIEPALVAKSIHAMHRAGVWHADLNAHNILLDGAQAWLIDFDRGRRGDAPLEPDLCTANLERLRRSMVKLAQERGESRWQAIHTVYQALSVMR